MNRPPLEVSVAPPAERQRPSPAADWTGPPGWRWRRRPRSARRHRWRRVLWSILYPRRGQRLLPTLSGVLLISLTLGIGIAAYNASNNILFITLALLLSCLILSGLLSWMNFARLSWRVRLTPPWRVGQTAVARVDVRNHKRLVPTYALAFDVRGTSQPVGTQLLLRERVEPAGGEARLEWTFRPAQRGREVIELTGVGSLFPFGFLRKVFATEVRAEALVWPAPVEYQWLAVAPPARILAGEPLPRLGQSGDLLALRRYQQGDSHRLIHWKASARLRQLMIRQFATESQEAYALWLETPAAVWTRPEQFELLCSLATTLAEDLFKLGRLASVAINAEPAQPVRRLADLEAFFDQVALVEPVAAPPPARLAGGSGSRHHLLTFAPDGARGVAAFIDGHKAVTA